MHLIDDGASTSAGDARVTLVLAPGAGSNAESPGLRRVGRALWAQGIRVVRCEFDYQHERRVSGRRGRQPSAEAVVEEYVAAAAPLVAAGPVVLGGLSFGGRVATMAAAEAGALAAVALGYPFHPPSAPEKVRTAHLLTTTVPVLVCQGTRDELGTRAEVESYGLPAAVHLHWLEGADHSLRPLARSGVTAGDVIGEATRVVRELVDELAAGRS